LHLKKHKRRDLEDTLRKLKQKRKISGKNKRYYLDASTLSQEYIGIFDARPLAQDRSFAFVIREEGDIYISREDIMNAMMEMKYQLGSNLKVKANYMAISRESASAPEREWLVEWRNIKVENI